MASKLFDKPGLKKPQTTWASLPPYSQEAREQYDEWYRVQSHNRNVSWSVESWFDPEILHAATTYQNGVLIYNNTYLKVVESTDMPEYNAKLVVFEVTWKMESHSPFLRVHAIQDTLEGNKNTTIHEVEVDMLGSWGWGVGARLRTFAGVNHLPFYFWKHRNRHMVLHKDTYGEQLNNPIYSNSYGNIRNMQLPRQWFFHYHNLYNATADNGFTQPTYERHWWELEKRKGMVPLFESHEKMPSYDSMNLHLLAKRADRRVDAPKPSA